MREVVFGMTRKNNQWRVKAGVTLSLLSPVFQELGVGFNFCKYEIICAFLQEVLLFEQIFVLYMFPISFQDL